jgi:ACS family hexuronate transporter-like MFS transporter
MPLTSGPQVESVAIGRPAESVRGHIRHLRWYIGGLLFIATVINYVDRQVFSVLAPDLQRSIGWSELDYSRIVIAFQASYAVMMMVSGRLLDRIGTKLGFALSVFAWSVVEVAHAFARTAFAFGVARFSLGLAEAGNFPAAIKTVAEWFPASERALATGLFNSGVALGAVIAPIVVPLMAAAYGWQSPFIVTGILGLVWLPAWWVLYGDRRSHRRLSDEERTLIESGQESNSAAVSVPWRRLFLYRQTWAYVLTKSLADPIWWFYLFWLPKFLAEGFGIRGTAVIPYLTGVFIAADLGCLAGGWLSSAFVKRGWTVNWARKGTMAILGAIMIPSVLTAIHLHDVRLVMALIAVACGCHQAWSTILFTLASDLFPSQAAASVAGIGGFAAGMVSIVAAELTGRVLNADPALYAPMFIAAAVLYPVGLIVFHALSPRMEPAELV